MNVKRLWCLVCFHVEMLFALTATDPSQLLSLFSGTYTW